MDGHRRLLIGEDEDAASLVRHLVQHGDVLLTEVLCQVDIRELPAKVVVVRLDVAAGELIDDLRARVVRLDEQRAALEQPRGVSLRR